MRISNFLKEDVSITEIFDQPYFKHNDHQSVLWHRTRVDAMNPELLTFKRRDEPKGTGIVAHNIIGSMSETRLGINVREETLFTYKSLSQTQDIVDLGSLYVVVPKGDYNLYYSKGISDMSVDLRLVGPLEHLDTNRKTGETLGSIIERDFVNDVMYEIKVQQEYDITNLEDADKLNRGTSFALMDIIQGVTNAVDGLSTRPVESIEHLYGQVMQTIDVFFNNLDELSYATMRFGASDSVYIISDDLKSNMHKTTIQFYKGTFNNLVEMLSGYFDNMQVAKSIDQIGNEEVMVHCKEFFLVSRQYYLDVLRQASK